MTTTDTAADTVAYHRERSWHFLDLVADELARGELEEASNKVWGAAAHAVKAAAAGRGWPHHAHALLEETVYRLIREAGAPEHIIGSTTWHPITSSGFTAGRRRRRASATAGTLLPSSSVRWKT